MTDARTKAAERRRRDAERQRRRKARYRAESRPMPEQVYRAIALAVSAELAALDLDPAYPPDVLQGEMRLRAVLIRATAVLVAQGYPIQSALPEVTRRLSERAWEGMPSVDPREPSLGALGRLGDGGLARIDT
ncbi:hypothetical protein [Salinarimonas rosea]|uniref:hypothetical protein n=1 Tax=Salinarimonas rosea TaxID=552063 RepID=UPI00048E06DE|nr:hypothetical protein [Salinarimonas rosea]